MKVLAAILALVFIVLAVLTATGAVNLHSHAIGLNGQRHLKHTILYALLAILSLVWMRFAANAEPRR